MRLFLFLCVLFCAAPCFSEENKVGVVDDNEFVITGLIIDETRTKAGHDFYDFYILKLADSVKSDNVTLAERSDANRHFIVVSLNETVVFEANLSPQQDALEEAANAAVTRTIEAILQNIDISNALQGI